MRRYIFILLAILTLSLPSCREDESFGKHEMIKMDRENAEITADGGIVTFKCLNYNLNLKSVKIFTGGELVRTWACEKLEEEYPIHEDDWFSIDFPPKEGDRYYKREFRVEVEPNNTSTERSAKFVLFNVFHSVPITVVQKGK